MRQKQYKKEVTDPVNAPSLNDRITTHYNRSAEPKLSFDVSATRWASKSDHLEQEVDLSERFEMDRPPRAHMGVKYPRMTQFETTIMEGSH